MSYENKLSRLETILQEHNGKEGVTPINIDTIKQALLKLGATSEESLAQCSFEDLESCGLPRLLAKRIALEFRSGNETGTVFVSERKAERMNVEELLSHYDPNEDNTVLKRLRELSRGQACIVFNDDKTIDVNTSAMLLTEIKKGFPERYLYLGTNNSVHKIFKIGEKLDNYVEENPFYPGRALRPDGTCDQLNRSWAGVPLNIRQFLYIARNVTGEIEDQGRNEFHSCLDKVLNDKLAMDSFVTRYPKAALKFKDLDREGNLPRLKIELGKASNQSFPEGRKVSWR